MDYGTPPEPVGFFFSTSPPSGSVSSILHIEGKFRERGLLTEAAAICCSLFHNLQGNVPFPLNLSPTKGVMIMGRRRPIELKFRLSADEYDLLQSKLAESGMNRNAFLVRLISGATIFPRDQLIQLNLEYSMTNRLLRGISTNINQIAKVANSTHSAPSAALLTDMYQDVQTLRNNLGPLWDKTRETLWQS